MSGSLLADRLRVAWAARLRFCRTLTAKRGREIAGQLGAEKAALESFSASLEEEFLQLGTLLRQIVSVARQVRNRSDEVIAAASGRAEDAAIQFAFQLLKKAEDLVQASREQHQHVLAAFEQMHLDLIQVARERSALMRTLSPLETTNVQFRIQACAFDAHTRTEFFALAEAIAGIVKDVQAAVGERFEELERAGRATGELIAKLAGTAAEQKRETEAMLAESRSHLSALNEVLLSSETAAQSISLAGANIASGVSKAIVALQCQDMATQKFQHIGSAVDEMIDHLEKELAGSLTRAAEADCNRFLADAGRVQLAQLQSVFEQLDEAAQQVKAGLREVDTEARVFADRAVRSGGATLDGHIIGRAVAGIHAVLAVIENAVGNVGTVAQLVLKLKSTFRDCTSQILGLALRLRTVALNAQIFAAHVDAGTALEVVARNTRLIADEAMRQLHEISVRVTQLVDLVVDLEQRLSDHRELAATERDLLAQEAEQSEQKLSALERELRSAVAAIGPLERELSDSVLRATECVRFPEAVAELSARSISFFQELIRKHSGSAPNSEGVFHRKVQKLKSQYTMAHERVVHELAFDRGVAGAEALQPVAVIRVETHADGLGGAGAAEATPASVEVDDDKLADNVELF